MLRSAVDLSLHLGAESIFRTPGTGGGVAGTSAGMGPQLLAFCAPRSEEALKLGASFEGSDRSA